MLPIKEYPIKSAETRDRYFHEAEILANLSHPNLPRITDQFILPNKGRYVVMDFIEGDNLQNIIDQSFGRLPESQVLGWIEQVCDVLQYLHTRHPPIIHRDVKPANISITPNGRAILTDFGIAKRHDPASNTAARAVVPGYSPPEQYGHGKTDARSDIYALGATLYTALTGQEPPDSIQRILGTRLPSPRSLNPSISPTVETAILKAMALTLTDRFPTAQSFLRALTIPNPVPSVKISPTVAMAPSVQWSGKPSPVFGARRAWIIGAVFVGVILILTLIIFSALGR